MCWADHHNSGRQQQTMAAFELQKRSLNLRAMGFCGVDDTVDPSLLQLISTRYSWVEWGVLFRPGPLLLTIFHWILISD
jgi:hypothetical protein